MSKIVIDHGTYYIKYGFSGYNIPQEKYKVADSNIIRNSVIINYDLMLNIWDDIFYCKLKINPKNTYILLTDTIYGGDANRDKIKDIMIKHYNFKGVSIFNQQVLALYSTCRDKGLVVDIGYSNTRVVPIYDSYVLTTGIVLSSFGYHKLSDISKDLYRERLITKISDMIIRSVRLSPIDFRMILLQNILLIGGGSKISGLPKDIVIKVKNVFLKCKVKIYAPKHREMSSWIGGSILCTMPDDIWTLSKI